MKFLIVDDHPIVREGLSALLSHVVENGSTIQARNVEEALAILDQAPEVDLLILDLQLPGVGGLEAISDFGRKRPDLPVIVLSSSENAKDARRAFELGALGYVPKSASPNVILAAIRLVLAGETYVPPLLLGNVSDQDREPVTATSAKGADLTARQIEILALVSAGHPNKAIARMLRLSEKTVKVHVTAIFKALRVVNRTQAAAAGRANWPDGRFPPRLPNA